MFAVKSTHSIKTPDGNDIPFYVADGELFFKETDLSLEVFGSFYGILKSWYFTNYQVTDNFVKQIDLSNLFKNNPQKFAHRDFWREVFNQDYSKVIAEVLDAQKFAKKCFELDLPEEWSRLKVDWVINTLPGRTSDWIEKCHNSLRILATNNEQRKDARRVYDEAWEILKEREKAANANKRPTVHDVLAKFGLTDDDLIHAALNFHENKFASEQAKRQSEFNKSHAELKAELRRILK